MNAEILTIGDEILIGQIVNTNSVWLAQQLNDIGIKVIHMTTVSDDSAAIFQAFEGASKRADFVFITGGLGPTKDDITKKIFADFLGRKLVVNTQVLAEVTEYFRKRGKDLNEINSLQALVPEGCEAISNAHGTAPGMWMKKGNCTFISMPGVPYEMKAMMTSSVIPKILKENKLPAIFHYSVLTQGIGESTIAELIEKWEDALPSKNIKLAYLPQPGMVRLRLSTTGEKKEILKAKVDSEIEILKTHLGKYIFGYEEYGVETPTLEKIVSDLLRSRKETISLVESCTGGYVSSLLVGLPGASEIFRGAIVPYTNKIKHELLEVNKALFDTVGAVSRECVEELAASSLKKFHSDYSIAISGIAGPTGGTAEKPVGTVWIAVAGKNNAVAKKYQFGDNRQRNIIASASAALNLLRKFILQEH